MTARPRRRIAFDDDSGSVLVLALVIVTVVAVVVTTLLSFSFSSLRMTNAVRVQDSAAATAAGAAHAAINELRKPPNTFNNDEYDSAYPKCFGNTETSDTLVLPDVVPGANGSPANSAVVTCSPQAGTGVDGGLVPITDKNKPGQAILTLSKDTGERGLYLKPLSSTIPFNVHGKVTSASNIVVDGGTLKSNTDVYARVSCTGKIDAPTVTCGGSSVPEDPGAPGQPNAALYVPDAATVPAPATVPANCSGSVVTFSPGYYKDAKALSDLTNNTGCKGKVWWFTPGTYYFDFSNTAKSSGINDPHQWWVSEGKLIAGTRADASGNPVPGAPLSSASIPGACVNPIDTTAAQGVQFIFGGDSQLQVRGTAEVEICGSYRTDRPPIAVYGVRESSAGASTVTVTNATATDVKTTSDVKTPGPAGFTVASTTGGNVPGNVKLPDALKAVDGTVAAWTSKKDGDWATMTLSPFLAGSGIPQGSVISSARLRILYGTSSAAKVRSVVITPTTPTGTNPALPQMIVDGSAQGPLLPPVPEIDFTEALQTSVDAGGLTGFSIEYGTTMALANLTERVEAVALDVTYTPPGLRAQTGCLTLLYTQTGGGCAFISTPESFSGKLYVQGTTYAPRAAIDISLSSASEQVMRFGVVSRVLAFKQTGGFSFKGPVIEVPDNSLGYGTQGSVVYLSVHVCQASSTCTAPPAGTPPALRARVYIKDPAGARQMLVQSWAAQR